MKVKISSKGEIYGTKVWTEDGRELSGIRSVVWRHEAGDIPVCEVELLLVPAVMNGVAKMLGPDGQEIRRIEYADGTIEIFVTAETFD